MEQPSYWAMRVDRTRPDFFMKEIRQGRLRQGWGYVADQDLREVEKIWNWRKGGDRSQLSSTQEETVRHFAFLGRPEPGMMRAGDIVLVLNLPEHGRFVLCRLTSDHYDYQITPEFGDYGHIREVGLLTESGVLWEARAVEAPLRTQRRPVMRLWSLDGYRKEVDKVLAASGDPKAVGVAYAEREKLGDLRQRAFDGALQAIEGLPLDALFQRAEWERLLTSVAGSLFQTRTIHTGGPNEQGADLEIRIRQPFSEDDLIVVVQVANHDGPSPTWKLDQLRTAIETRRKSGGIVALAVLATTGLKDDVLEQARKNLQAETHVAVSVCAGDDFRRLIRRGLLVSALADNTLEVKPEP